MFNDFLNWFFFSNSNYSNAISRRCFFFQREILIQFGHHTVDLEELKIVIYKQVAVDSNFDVQLLPYLKGL